MATIPDRVAQLAALRAGRPVDVLIIGGGASGLGAAVDAAARGYSTVLLERHDFASGTSSRSTKLIHGGVRYLRQGDLAMVHHALVERRRLLDNAGHLVHPLRFVIPAHSQIQRVFYGSGLKLYDLLAGSSNLDHSHWLDRGATLAALPGLNAGGIAGGIEYWDGQFDDARLAIALMRTAVDLGAACLNYLPVTGLIKDGERVAGALAEDAETGERFDIPARVVINATGVYVDAVRRFEDAAARAMLSPSQGIHLVVDADFLPGNTALMIPETEDGRVMFAIPWQGKLLLGTTDTPRPVLDDEPLPLAEEVDFLLRTAAGYLRRPPTRGDVRSAFAGLRPLLHGDGGAGGTAALSREHEVRVSRGGLVTVAGGKWTTYRLMAEQVIDRAVTVGGLARSRSITAALKLHGWQAAAAGPGPYGADAVRLAGVAGSEHRLHPALDLTEGMVRFALREEGGRTIEDILARRHRALFLDADAAAQCIGRVAELLVEEIRPSPTRLGILVQRAHKVARCFKLDPAG